LSALIDEANATIHDWNDRLDQAYADYNGVISTAEDLMSDITGRLRSEWDEKSETWQQSDRGIDAEGWVSQFEEITFTQLDTYIIDEIPHPDDASDTADEIENLPTEPE
jgi:hypothetical protein